MAMAKLGKALVLVMALAAPVMGQTAKQHHENESATQDSEPQSPIRYWEIPLEGTFGVEIQASGVEDAIEKAIRQKLQAQLKQVTGPRKPCGRTGPVSELGVQIWREKIPGRRKPRG